MIGYAREMARWATAADAAVGRVMRVDNGLAAVLTRTGPHRASVGGGLLARMAKDPGEGPCTGDWCVLRTWPDQRVTLERVLPRRTAVRGPRERRDGRVLCANVDIAAVVVAIQPRPVQAEVERLVALAWESGARPLVVLTEADPVTDADLVAHDVAAAIGGVEVVTVSARTGRGVAALRERLEGRLTIALLGASGHDTSSLTDALVGAEVLATQNPGGIGRRRSVRRELVPLPGGGAVVDLPGVRVVGRAARHGA